LPVKVNQDIDKIIQAAADALKKLQEDQVYAESVLPGSKVNGIEDFKNLEIMIISITIVTFPAKRWEIAKRYRYLVKKEFEKQKLLFA
jgi:small conductance mechanosensitive channel